MPPKRLGGGGITNFRLNEDLTVSKTASKCGFELNIDLLWLDTCLKLAQR